MKLIFPLAGCLLGLFLSSASAQSVEEYVLTQGRRVAADSVKPTGNGFSAVLITGANAQNITFTAKEILSTTLREPGELGQARTLIATGKFKEAVELTSQVEKELEPFRQVPGTWWSRAMMLRMDAMACNGEASAAAALVDPKLLADLPEEVASLLTDFQTIVDKPKSGQEAKAAALQSLAKRTTDPWSAARTWLEIGNTLAAQGKMEEAVKGWLRVAVFHPAERDLAVRGTILAARGLQQIERPKDGLKLLDDYLIDHIASPYESTIKIEAAKIDPKRENTPAEAATPDSK